MPCGCGRALIKIRLENVKKVLKSLVSKSSLSADFGLLFAAVST
jgi:hypothetical protein